MRCEAARLADRVRHPDSTERQILDDLVELPAGELSEGAALAALVDVGRAAVAERLLEEGYAALAAAEDGEDRAVRAAMRGRTARLGE